MNPGLSCTDLAASQNLCVEAAEVRNNNSSTISLAPLDPYPALSPGMTVPQSPILAFASVDGNARSTFYGETIFQSDSQHLDAFAHNDMNSDGKLDRSELQTMMSMDPSVVRGISEVNSTLTADNLVTEMLKSADLNGTIYLSNSDTLILTHTIGDGSIDKDEFLFAIRQVQNATNVVTELAADNTALGQQRKREFVTHYFSSARELIFFRFHPGYNCNHCCHHRASNCRRHSVLSDLSKERVVPWQRLVKLS